MSDRREFIRNGLRTAEFRDPQKALLRPLGGNWIEPRSTILSGTPHHALLRSAGEEESTRLIARELFETYEPHRAAFAIFFTEVFATDRK